MKINFLESSSILKKFLIFNFLVFSFLGIFTLIYLNAIKPNLIKDRSIQHLKIIKNTSDHIQRLKVDFNKEETIKYNNLKSKLEGKKYIDDLHNRMNALQSFTQVNSSQD